MEGGNAQSAPSLWAVHIQYAQGRWYSWWWVLPSGDSTQHLCESTLQMVPSISLSFSRSLQCCWSKTSICHTHPGCSACPECISGTVNWAMMLSPRVAPVFQEGRFSWKERLGWFCLFLEESRHICKPALKIQIGNLHCLTKTCLNREKQEGGAEETSAFPSGLYTDVLLAT